MAVVSSNNDMGLVAVFHLSGVVVMIMSMVSSNNYMGLVAVLNLSGVVVSHIMCMLMASSNRNMALMSYMAVASLSIMMVATHFVVVAMITSRDHLSLMSYMRMSVSSMVVCSHIVVMFMTMLSSNHVSSLVVDLVAVFNFSRMMAMVSSNNYMGLVAVLHLSSVVVSRAYIHIVITSGDDMSRMVGGVAVSTIHIVMH